MVTTPLLLFAITFAALLLLAGMCHLAPKPLAERAIRAPGLDVLVFLFTVAPWTMGIVLGAALVDAWWWGVLGYAAISVAAQAAALIVWAQLHELIAGKPRREHRIHPTLNNIVGRTRNHAAVWWTAWAVPLFWLVRMGEWFIYPPLTWWARLPKYRSAEWVNVSRQKFDGLVGYDLIWCLYCDWMTGVWSLGSEMLRNVESFWCPIRFSDTAKCDNCAVDFPDINTEWIPADATMGDVTRLLREKYPGPRGDSPWFGHPVRLTVEGKNAAGTTAESHSSEADASSSSSG
jgi:hypothetical protein